MFRYIYIIPTISLIINLLSISAPAQSTFTIGIEQDALPYFTGGYFGAVWAGKGHLRGRALLARVHKPDFITPDGFTNNHTTAYAFLADYFLKEDWKGWWIGAGLVYWDNSIQSDQKLSTAQYHNTLLNGSLGYNWKFYRHFYLSPWAGMSLRINNRNKVTVDNQSFTPPLFNPEVSLKLGWHF
ncbi:MAG: hypothetical protein SFU99_01690 [Saprospiraceae bacterium]|nr:hypothetical protein [Saprospiraceae bacterium]